MTSPENASAAQMASALAGLRVVDFSRYMPGAYVSWIFGDMGADIVCIEHPRELAKQAAVFNTAGETPEQALLRRARPTHTRNKRSLLINPGNAQAREVIYDLIRRADVLIEDYRPGVLAKMGYAHEDMVRLNPRLVYVSVSFTGQTGPYSNRAGHDPAALALAGALSRLNGQTTPTMPGLQVADVLTGAHATIATLVALQARGATGRGQYVDVAMSDCCMPLTMLTVARNPDLSKLGPPDGAWHPKGGVWLCGDGKYICTTDMETAYWRRFCDAIGRPDFADKQHAVAEYPAIEAALKDIFRTRSRDEWAAVFAAADTQAMPVFSIGEALDDPHNRARGMVVETKLGDSTIRQIGTPFHLSDTPARMRHLAPAAGAHNDEILAELGWSAERIGALRAAGGFDA
jgi:crotonobetainyl-CoA:carnitine CoA-transferase CaiB-like acyl-CoA transferase